MRSPDSIVTPSKSAVCFSEAFDRGVVKTRRNLVGMIEAPGSWAFDGDGDYSREGDGFFEISNWTSSFFTGMGVLSFLRTGEEEFLQLNGKLEDAYRAKVGEYAHETMHDLGFLYSLYAVAMFQTGGEERFRELGLRAAEVLAGRFVAPGNYLRAWGRMDEGDTDYAGLAIIDSVMNLPLLYWASEQTGDPKYREVAVKHSDTTLKHFVRGDESVSHAFRFDPVSGEAMGSANYCGRGVDSQWARGMAWAMYGFALGYLETGDIRQLEASLSLTKRFIGCLGDDAIPVWDFKLEENEEPLRDSSAAAIAACAIQKLEAADAVSGQMVEAKFTMLTALCSSRYLDTSAESRGLLRDGQTGDGLGKARNVYTSWGDYFFMEALGREMGIKVEWW